MSPHSISPVPQQQKASIPFSSMLIAKGKLKTDSCEDGHLNNMDEEKVEAFKVLFASLLNNTNRSWAAQSPEVKDHE